MSGTLPPAPAPAPPPPPPPPFPAPLGPQEYAKAIIEGGVKIVETAGSSPHTFVPLFKKAGIITIREWPGRAGGTSHSLAGGCPRPTLLSRPTPPHDPRCPDKCVTIRHALSAQKLGVDIISLDGFECAGHPGEADIGNFVLQVGGPFCVLPLCSPVVHVGVRGRGGEGGGVCVRPHRSTPGLFSVCRPPPPHFLSLRATRPTLFFTLPRPCPLPPPRPRAPRC
jgi:hypothetical protein